MTALTNDSDCDNAVNYTANWVMISGGSIAETFYSSENNDSSSGYCGDGFAGSSSYGTPCIYDPCCAGTTRSGHGAGMCQWGSYRWSMGWLGGLGHPLRDWTWIPAALLPDFHTDQRRAADRGRHRQAAN